MNMKVADVTQMHDTIHTKIIGTGVVYDIYMSTDCIMRWIITWKCEDKTARRITHRLDKINTKKRTEADRMVVHYFL